MQTRAVMDIRGGRMVRATGGERATYRPMSLPGGVWDPAAIAAALTAEADVDGLYVADLDSLAGREVSQPAWLPRDAWLDAGFRTADEVAACRCRPVVALEAWPNPATLAAAASAHDDAVFSLDLRVGRPVTASTAWPADPLAIAEVALSAGFRTLLVLDVASVGGGRPATLSLCRKIRRLDPRLRLAAGGGFTPDAASTARAGDAGVDVRLIGTALFDRLGLRTE